MDYFLSMEIVEAEGDMPHDTWNLVLRKFSFVFGLHESTIGEELENQVDMSLIIEKTIERCNVVMIQKGLYFYLSFDLRLKFHLFNLLFR
jgi:hypothetical protein